MTTCVEALLKPRFCGARKQNIKIEKVHFCVNKKRGVHYVE